MADERWERYGAATGIVFVILGVIAYIIAGPPPIAEAERKVADVVAHYVDNSDSLVLSNYLWGVAGLFYFWFLGSLRSYLRRAEGETGRLSAVAFGAGIAGGVVFTVGTLVSVALASDIAGAASEELTLALHEVATHAYIYATFAFVVLAAATSVVSGRYRAFPGWLGWLGWMVALLSLLSSAAVFAETGPLAFGGALSVVGFAVFFLWFLALSVTVTQRAGRPAA
jgi:hypothetical protein